MYLCTKYMSMCVRSLGQCICELVRGLVTYLIACIGLFGSYVFFFGVVDTTIHCHRCVVIVAVVVVSQLWGHMNCLFHLASSIPYPLAVVSCHFGPGQMWTRAVKIAQTKRSNTKTFCKLFRKLKQFWRVSLDRPQKSREKKTKEHNKTYKHDNNEGQMSFDATKTTHTPIHTRTHTLLTFPYQCHVILVAVRSRSLL